MLFTAVLSKYFCSVVCNLLFAWFGWMYCDCRYTPGKCGSFTDQSKCLSTRPGLKCVWNTQDSMCQPISSLSHLFMMTVPEFQDTQTAVEKIYRYEKCHCWAFHSFILPLLLCPYGLCRLLLNCVVFLDTLHCLRQELYNIWEAVYAIILGGKRRTYAAGLISVQVLRLALSTVQSFTHDWPHTTVRILECWITCLNLELGNLVHTYDTVCLL